MRIKLLGSAALLMFAVGCGSSRVHILPELQQIHRVAVINLADRNGTASPDSEFFTNEFVSVGFSVVERGHLQEVIKEAFTSTGYLDERSVAEWGKGLGIEGVVLNQVLDNAPSKTDPDQNEVIGWVRIVNVETGQIVLTYNVEVRVDAGRNPTRASKVYAERVVDAIKAALKNRKITPGQVHRTQIRKVNVTQESPAAN